MKGSITGNPMRRQTSAKCVPRLSPAQPLSISFGRKRPTLNATHLLFFSSSFEASVWVTGIKGDGVRLRLIRWSRNLYSIFIPVNTPNINIQ